MIYDVFLVKLAFIVLFVWSICVWARPFARLVTSRLDRQISDLTIQDDLGRIHIGIGPLLPTVCTSFEPSDRKSDGHYVSGIYFSFLYVFFLNHLINLAAMMNFSLIKSRPPDSSDGPDLIYLSQTHDSLF